MKAIKKAIKKVEAQDQFVGIDVSKKTLDVYVRPSKKVLSYANEKRGIKKLTKSGV